MPNLQPRRVVTRNALPGNLFALVILAFFTWNFFVGVVPHRALDKQDFPALTGRVVDTADILDSGVRARLDEISADLEQKTQAQLVIATIPDLKGVTIEDYGYQLGRFWGIGRKDVNDGVLLLVAPNDRRVRIEVGYGLEGTLTDAAARLIIDSDILPRFRAGDMAGGVVAGAQAIAGLVANSETAAPAPHPVARADSEENPNAQDARGYLLALLFLALFFMGPLWGVGSFLWCLLNPAYGAQMVRPQGRSSGWSSGGWGGGGSGGGGFSGGGGSFGGGGSSGSW
ncbi:MAG: TPM domain-containing protein [Rhodospirillales bacterium]|nr:TPM domain-containing protein [Alphaproteobacteria bacterium]MCB9987600.1 TPM domain-containing protein [Rhodospirillales bacterium]USO07685.1 MAG: TPM domain-containing protein [Rhodospirillales bacterium]